MLRNSFTTTTPASSMLLNSSTAAGNNPHGMGHFTGHRRKISLDDPNLLTLSSLEPSLVKNTCTPTVDEWLFESGADFGDFEPIPIGPGGYEVMDSPLPIDSFNGGSGNDSATKTLMTSSYLAKTGREDLKEDFPWSLATDEPYKTIGQDTVQESSAPVPLVAVSGAELVPPMNTRPITPNDVMKRAPLPFSLTELEADPKVSMTKKAPTPPPKAPKTAAVKATTGTTQKRRRFRHDQAGQWSTMFKQLLQFKELHGHCSVPRTSKQYPLLGRWVKRQRYQRKLMIDGHKKSTMTPERAQALEDVAFVWDSYGTAWSERFEDLKQFVQKYGHANVPSPFPENRKLANWTKFQRREYRAVVEDGKKVSSVNMDRILALEGLGFQWELRKSSSRRRKSISTTH